MSAIKVLIADDHAIVRMELSALLDAEDDIEVGIALDSVKEHINVVFAKLGAANRAEAVAIALRKQLLKI